MPFRKMEELAMLLKNYSAAEFTQASAMMDRYETERPTEKLKKNGASGCYGDSRYFCDAGHHSFHQRGRQENGPQSNCSCGKTINCIQQI